MKNNIEKAYRCPLERAYPELLQVGKRVERELKALKEKERSLSRRERCDLSNCKRCLEAFVAKLIMITTEMDKKA